MKILTSQAIDDLRTTYRETYLANPDEEVSITVVARVGDVTESVNIYSFVGEDDLRADDDEYYALAKESNTPVDKSNTDLSTYSAE